MHFFEPAGARMVVSGENEDVYQFMFGVMIIWLTNLN